MSLGLLNQIKGKNMNRIWKGEIGKEISWQELLPRAYSFTSHLERTRTLDKLNVVFCCWRDPMELLALDYCVAKLKQRDGLRRRLPWWGWPTLLELVRPKDPCLQVTRGRPHGGECWHGIDLDPLQQEAEFTGFLRNKLQETAWCEKIHVLTPRELQESPVLGTLEECVKTSTKELAFQHFPCLERMQRQLALLLLKYINFLCFLTNYWKVSSLEQHIFIISWFL